MPTAVQRSEKEIARRIQSGELAPGARLSHRWLARELKVSNTPVVQALRKLEGMGLIERMPASRQE
jgi:DNA-binding GntR family transcriptional regulator